MEPYQLSATEASNLVRQRELGCEELLRSCLDRITKREPSIRAWLYLDTDRALRDARELDKIPWKGPLHGLPVGFKDNMDVAGMPTTFNSPVCQGKIAARDSACARVLRESGALLLGKLDLVEFAASGRRAATRNPCNINHTPGGSSSGSAAAVADCHVPLAIGNQAGGSIIRPAAFCGIHGFKPSHSVISNEGVKPTAPTLDTLGWFSRTAADLALPAKAFRLPGLAATTEVALARARVGICRTPMWDSATPECHAILERTVQHLAGTGCEIVEVVLPEIFDNLAANARAILRTEVRASLLPEVLSWGDRLDATLLDRMAKVPLSWDEFARAQDNAAEARGSFDELWAKLDLDVLLTPATCGEAPEELNDVGDSIFNGLWTLLHVPCVALPVGHGPRGLPLSVQLVGRRFQDLSLLSISKTIAHVMATMPDCYLSTNA